MYAVGYEYGLDEQEDDERFIELYERYEELLDMDPESGTPEGDELEGLVRAMEAYA